MTLAACSGTCLSLMRSLNLAMSVSVCGCSKPNSVIHHNRRDMVSYVTAPRRERVYVPVRMALSSSRSVIWRCLSSIFALMSLLYQHVCKLCYSIGAQQAPSVLDLAAVLPVYTYSLIFCVRSDKLSSRLVSASVFFRRSETSSSSMTACTRVILWA